jgi:trimeric autotransporter adhesin
MKKLVFLLFLTCSAFSQIPQLVKDINPRNRGINVYKPLGSVGATSYFTFFDFETGLELWKTDHTSNGTVKVKVISTLPIAPSKIINLNGIAIFKLETEAYGLEMWRSDGTEAGTYMIKDIRPGPLGSLPGNSNDWILFNNFIYFNGEDGVNGEELWRTDGTEAGTQMLVNLNGILTDSRPQGFVTHNGNLYFGALGKLWISDGTAVGTTEIATIGSSLSNSPAQLISCGNKVFF